MHYVHVCELTDPSCYAEKLYLHMILAITPYSVPNVRDKLGVSAN